MFGLRWANIISIKELKINFIFLKFQQLLPKQHRELLLGQGQQVAPLETKLGVMEEEVLQRQLQAMVKEDQRLVRVEQLPELVLVLERLNLVPWEQVDKTSP